MEPVPDRLAVMDERELALAEPTTILLEYPEKRIYVASDRMPSVSELVEWTIEAKAGPPDDVRGVLIGRPTGVDINEAIGRGQIIIFECKGHVIYPPELRSYIWYNVVPEILTATLLRKEAIELHAHRD